MSQINFKNRWVLITGASSGLGLEIARYLAYREEANLIIVARRLERLLQLKQEIESQSNSRVHVIQADAGTPEGIETLFRESTAHAEVFALINNAGTTFYGRSGISDWSLYSSMIDLNLKAVIYLSLKFLSYFQERKEGALLNITSEAAFVPIPYQAVYSASKHAAQAFTEALYMEYKNSGITISSFAPGGIATEMLTNSGLDKKHPLNSPFNMKPETVARLAIKAFKKKKYLSVPGWMNQLTLFLIRFLSRKQIAWASERIYRPIG